MTFLEKLKIDRQDLIDRLCENIASLEKIAFEQQAEIERLENDITLNAQKIYAGGIKEFAKRLREKSNNYVIGFDNLERSMVDVSDIDNLIKEMVGE